MDTGFLVRLSIGQWSARKVDRKATKEARERAGATDKAAVRVSKALVAAEALDAVAAIATAARAEHEKRTVPWQYRGPGAIAAAGYADYKKAMAAHEHDFWRAVDRFVDCYDAEREAAREYLGSMYDPNDYPGDVRSKFSFETIAEPMPKGEDFRVAGLSATDQEAITRDLETRRAAALDNAQGVAWERIAEHVGKLKAKVEAYKPATDNEKAQGVFRDSLVENLQELVTMLPSLNIKNDKRIEEIGATVETELCAYSADQLRESQAARADVAQSAADILAQVQAIWAARTSAAATADIATENATDAAESEAA